MGKYINNKLLEDIIKEDFKILKKEGEKNNEFKEMEKLINQYGYGKSITYNIEPVPIPISPKSQP